MTLTSDSRELGPGPDKEPAVPNGRSPSPASGRPEGHAGAVVPGGGGHSPDADVASLAQPGQAALARSGQGYQAFPGPAGRADGRLGPVEQARIAATMGARVGLTVSQVADLIALLDLTPTQIRALVTSRDSQLWRAAASVAPLYLDPPENAVVWSVDDRAGVGPPDSVMFSALDVHGRSLAAWVTDSSRASFVDFLEDLELAVEPGLDVHCIADDRPSHNNSAVRAFLVEHPRLGLHLIPRAAPWLNQVYTTTYPMMDQRLEEVGQLGSLAELTSVVLDLVEDHNALVSPPAEVPTEPLTPGRRSRLGQATDRPWVATAVALVLAGLFVALRLVATGGDPTTFIVAGAANAVPGPAHADLKIYPLGYDGQFYYLLAHDPTIHTQHADGMSLDLPAYREQRIVYPVVAWILSGGGQVAALPWALILINLGAMGALAYMGGLLAREAGRHALWGLALPAFPAFTLVLAKDVAELLAAALLTAALIFLRRHRVGAATVALTLAVLTKETVAFAVGAIGLVWVVQWVFRRRTGMLAAMRRSWLVFVVPTVALGAWELFLRILWHSSPIPPGRLTPAAPLLDARPFAHQAINSVIGTAGGVPRAHLFASASANTNDQILYLASFAFIFLIGVATLVELWSSRARDHEKAAFLVGVLAVMVLSGVTWATEWSFLRAVSPIWVLAFMVLIAARRRWVSVAPMLAGGVMTLGFALVVIPSP